MKCKIEKNAVQETLILPLYSRKLCTELYPNRLRLFRGREKLPQPDAALWCAGGGHAAG